MRASALVLLALSSLAPAAGAADAGGCRDLPILPAALGVDAGLVGAALAAGA